MKCFRSVQQITIATALLCLGFALAASGALPPWMVNVEAQSALESAFFRLMDMPAGAVMGRRPPSETRPALADLIKAKPNDGELYALRAREDEQALDFDAAEQDWKQFAQRAQDKGGANLALADFYHRRVRPLDEIRTLALVGQMPPAPADALLAPSQQRSWNAFERIFQVAQAQAVTNDVRAAQYKAWIARYPRERSLYLRYFQFLLDQKDIATAQQAIAEYQKAFPEDAVFPVKAKALVSSKQSVEQGLAVYDQAFQPLWPPELVRNFFDLMKETRTTRKYLDKWRGQLDANPDDINTLARIFFYYQQQGKLDVAQQVITDYRLRKEARKAQWSADELFTLARLLEQVHAYSEASRYYYALYNAQSPDAKEKALAGLTSILLTAPEQPLRLGAGEISIYQDIATLDTGPGFLNGILSLILNNSSPASQFSQEEQRAVPYFNRGRAAELLAAFDTAFPKSSRRPELHEQLIETYGNYSANDAVIRDGKSFLATFPDAPQRTQVSLLMADAYARTNQSREEFAIYDAVLDELARNAQRVPLGETADRPGAVQRPPEAEAAEGTDEEQCEDCDQQPNARARVQRRAQQKAFSVGQTTAEAPQSGPRSPEYARVLERYISRLVQQKQITQALTVLRREIDRNPNDPGLYERLASFLQQNRLGEETEQVYKRAIQQFPDRSWYHKLARWYLGQRRRQDFAQLSNDVVKIFAGTELQSYFEQVIHEDAQTGPQLYLQLNLFAHQRFPHNRAFVRNLLAAYSRRETRDGNAYNKLLREHWMEDDDLRNQLFRSLSGQRLEAELHDLEAANAAAGNWYAAATKNPLAVRFIADAHLWTSHFEQAAAPLAAVARVFPADVEAGRNASAVYRSLAYFEPRDTDLAVAIEQNLLKADPGNRETLARIGDIYADREQFGKAAPYWEKIPATEPGGESSYLDAATIYWDYFDFDNALRLLNDGRTKLGRTDLYSYEAGAIYEAKSEYAKAVTEYAKGSLAQEGSPSQARLIQLATRPNYRDLIEQATLKPTEGANPDPDAVDLRIALLESQNRKDDLEKFLLALVERATALDLLENLEQLAQQKSIESARQRALERQAELTTDPIRRLELRYQLVRFYENKKDFAAAQRNVEELYRANPKILGVVRATVDFYWRTKQQQKAIDVLLQASKDSYPALSKRFSFEAARKMTDAGQYEPARQLLDPLTKDQPYNSEYLAAVADTYARAGDNEGLKKFYLEKIALFQSAPLDAAQKTSQIAALRRGLIPALTRLKDYAGAVDQYELIINGYPEDEGLTTEAAFYAAKYDLKQRLLDMYVRSVQQSPRDPRWAIVLARLQTNFEDYAAAADVYARAITVRPDRVDLRTARAGLLERLMRFDDAAGEYTKLYELTYKDPSWMLKLAEVRARQGRTADVVAALKLALIEGRPEQPENYYNAAQRLEKWSMLAQARDFADQGMKLAGDTALDRDTQGVKLWTRIMTRMRKQDDAWARLDAIRRAVDSSTGAALARPAVPGSDEDAVRRSSEAVRRVNARNAMTACLQEMGVTIDRYFVPEERALFATSLAQRRAGLDARDVNDFLVPLAQSAGLAQLEAQWRQEVMLSNAAFAQGGFERLAQLQTARLKFNDLGAAMEAIAARADANGEQGRQTAATYLQRAAEAYRADGNWQAELRVLRALVQRNALGDRDRYYALLLAHDQPSLMALESSQTAAPTERDHIGNFVLANADGRVSQQTIDMRSRGLPPVWLKSYTALTGLYFRDSAPAVDGAFRSALADATIGERLGKTLDRTQYLAGDIWFYYGSRYGEYLGSVTKQPSAADYLPASLEQRPGQPAAYETLADYYNDAGDGANAIVDYTHVLDLVPDRPDIHDKIAVILWRQNKRAEASTHWRQALTILTRQVGRRQVPETFWRDFGAIVDHLGTRKVFAEHRREVDTLLRAYVKKNGTWRNTALMRDAYRALGDDTAGVTWLLDLASVAPSPPQMVAEFAGNRWIPESRKEPIYQRMLQYKQDAVSHAQGMEREYALQDLRSWQRRWLDYLLDTNQYDRARTEFAAVAADSEIAAGFVAERLRLDAAQSRLDTTIDSYRADPDHAPDLNTLRQVATDLQKRKDTASARKILEYVFAREIEEHKLSAANLLGLSEIRIEAGDMNGALELLHRATLVVGQPFENLDAAASLLMRTGHPGEAIAFYEALVKAEPWNADARVNLASAQLKAGKDAAPARAALIAIVREPGLVYDTRLRAAAAVAPVNEMLVGSNELRVVSNNLPTILPIMNPAFFYQARIKAAENAGTPAAKMQLLRAAIEDYPSRETARIPFFRAALDAGQNQLAIASIQPLMQSVFAGLRGNVSAGPVTENDSGEDQVADTRFGWDKIPQSERASIARAVGAALDSLDRWPEALRFLNAAVELETAADKKAAARRQVQELRARMLRRSQNEARRPIIHTALEQDRVVRPMVVARSAPPPPVAAAPRRTP